MVRRNMDKYNATVDFVDRNVEEGRGQFTAFIHMGKHITYSNIQKLVNKMGNALKSVGIGFGDRILLLMHDGPEFIGGFWGAIKIGAVPIPLNTILQPKDYEYMLNDSAARVLMVHQNLLPKIEAISGNIDFLRDVIIISENGEANMPYNHIFRQASPVLEAAPTIYDDIAFCLYSSGSTGPPKGTVHLQHDMAYSADCYGKKILRITSDDRIFSASKLFFAYGLGNSMYFPFRVGATSILFPGRPFPESIFELIKKQKPTIFFGVPTLYNNMLNHFKDPDNNYTRDIFSSVRLCISAGEALPPNIYREWKEIFGLEILDGIGSTELCHIFISNREGEVREGATGKMVPGYQGKIVNENGTEVPVGTIGNLMVKGDSSAAFYWRNHNKTKSTMVGEWIDTGDKYQRDSEGYYYYAGRSDDMFKVGGIWVSPFEVECALLEHPSVIECAVIGRPDGKNLIKPKAFVVLKKGQEPTDEKMTELKDFVKKNIAPYKYPREIQFLPELPKTATGKIQRFKLN